MSRLMAGIQKCVKYHIWNHARNTDNYVEVLVTSVRVLWETLHTLEFGFLGSLLS